MIHIEKHYNYQKRIDGSFIIMDKRQSKYLLFINATYYNYYNRVSIDFIQYTLLKLSNQEDVKNLVYG